MYRSMWNKSKLIFTPLDRPTVSELSRGVIPGIKRVHRPKMIRNKLFVQNWCFTLLRAGIVTGAQRHWMELNPFSIIRGGKFFFLPPFWHGTILGPFILLIVSGHGVFHAKHHRPDVDGYPGGLFDGDDDYNADGTKLSIFFSLAMRLLASVTVQVAWMNWWCFAWGKSGMGWKMWSTGAGGH